ncbi:sulfurtransferase [Gordonia sp. PKS22-38]|uniref:Sulfurtransferase n=1 Tax=Gordonia prachuapensis TaxID=3115651 RepID=A0ABU7MSZ8_9ACTN|nr:sulfurtransferase [Gordonia sp. PKS22-38]
MTTPHVISATDLHKRLEERSVRIIDATVHLSFDEGGAHVESGRATYLDGHIPGAVFADQIAGLSDPNGEAPFAAAPSDRFAAAVGALGVGDDTQVVVYDTVNGIWATRLWWQFRLEGFDDVTVLDGGLAAWVDAGFPTETGDVDVPAASFTARRRADRIYSTTDVATSVDDPAVLLINALDRDAFAAARIPGSVNVPFGDLVDESGQLKPVAELREIFDAVGALDESVRPVTYCGGGIAATAAAFALHVAGRDDSAVYDGSMNAWTADPDRPLETDSRPS